MATRFSTAFTIAREGRAMTSICRTLNRAVRPRMRANASSWLSKLMPRAEETAEDAKSKKKGKSIILIWYLT